MSQKKKFFQVFGCLETLPAMVSSNT